MPGSTGGVQPT